MFDFRIDFMDSPMRQEVNVSYQLFFFFTIILHSLSPTRPAKGARKLLFLNISDFMHKYSETLFAITLSKTFPLLGYSSASSRTFVAHSLSYIPSKQYLMQGLREEKNQGTNKFEHYNSILRTLFLPFKVFNSFFPITFSITNKNVVTAF